jgi:hypothetical protein
MPNVPIIICDDCKQSGSLQKKEKEKENFGKHPP